jgi:hypothetical protein
VPDTGTIENISSFAEDGCGELSVIDRTGGEVFKIVAAAPLPSDVDGDGDRDILDLLIVLSSWGPCPAPPADCPGDIDDSGAVDLADLPQVPATWSFCA